MTMTDVFGDPQRGERVVVQSGNGLAERPETRQVINLASGVRWERLTPASDRDVEFLISMSLEIYMNGRKPPGPRPMRDAVEKGYEPPPPEPDEPAVLFGAFAFCVRREPRTRRRRGRRTYRRR